MKKVPRYKNLYTKIIASIYKKLISNSYREDGSWSNKSDKTPRDKEEMCKSHIKIVFKC